MSRTLKDRPYFVKFNEAAKKNRLIKSGYDGQQPNTPRNSDREVLVSRHILFKGDIEAIANLRAELVAQGYTVRQYSGTVAQTGRTCAVNPAHNHDKQDLWHPNSLHLDGESLLYYWRTDNPKKDFRLGEPYASLCQECVISPLGSRTVKVVALVASQRRPNHSKWLQMPMVTRRVNADGDLPPKRRYCTCSFCLPGRRDPYDRAKTRVALMPDRAVRHE